MHVHSCLPGCFFSVLTSFDGHAARANSFSPSTLLSRSHPSATPNQLLTIHGSGLHKSIVLGIALSLAEDCVSGGSVEIVSLNMEMSWSLSGNLGISISAYDLPSGNYSVCIRFASSSVYTRVGGNTTVIVPDASSFSPISWFPNSTALNLNICGVALNTQSVASVRFQANARVCSNPSVDGNDDFIVGVLGSDVASSGCLRVQPERLLPAGFYAVCIKYVSPLSTFFVDVPSTYPLLIRKCDFFFQNVIRSSVVVMCGP